MKRIISLILLSLLTITACNNAGITETVNTDSTKGDPFTTTTAKFETENSHSLTPDEVLTSVSVGGYDLNINGNQPIEYNGEEIIIPVTMSANAVNEYDITAGFSIYINGIVQLISEDGGEETGMIIKSLPRDKSVSFKVALNPIILEDDEDKKELAVHFEGFFNPHFYPEESHPSFGNSRKGGTRWLTSLDVKKPITNFITPNIQTQHISEIGTGPERTKYEKLAKTQFRFDENSGICDFYNEFNTSPAVPLSEDGKLNTSILIIEPQNHPYRVSFLLNNQPTTFNGGMDYLDMDVKLGYIQAADVVIDNAKAGDSVQAIFIPIGEREEGEYIYSQRTPAELVVEAGYKMAG